MAKHLQSKPVKDPGCKGGPQNAFTAPKDMKKVNKSKPKNC